MTRFLDRRTGAVTELDRSLWVTMTPGGLIGAGEFGAVDGKRRDRQERPGPSIREPRRDIDGEGAGVA